LIRKVFVLAVLSLCAALGSYSQTHAKESLRGLRGVFVYVHPVGKDLEAGGLSTTRVQSAVEKALRQAGIIVYGEPQPADGSANLIIETSIVKHPQGPILYGVEVALVQDVHLTRAKEAHPFPAKTWSANMLGLTTPNRTDLILEPVMSKVDEFIGDFKEVNRSPHD
jgi:hypothetical protein